MRRTGSVLRGLSLARVAVVTHRRLHNLFGTSLDDSLRRSGVRASWHFMPEGEGAKSLETVNRLYGELLRVGLGREDGILALGGGVCGDTAGFVAATFLRGVAFVQAPTTLLAQIDSAIGGKVGVNHALGKNLIGAFCRPKAVLIDTDCLRTLPDRQLRSGLFELLKYGFIGARELFLRMEQHPRTFRAYGGPLHVAIAEAVRLKLRVVRTDERETGLRRILNFGHTVGHGLEAAGEFRKLSHGEAVGWGMIAAVRLSKQGGRVSSTLAERMERCIRSVGPLPSLRRLDTDDVMAAVDRDKKKGQKGLRFVLPVAIGRVEVVESTPRDAVRSVVARLVEGG